MTLDRVVRSSPAAEKERVVRAVCREAGNDTLVWMYERLSHRDRRRFFALRTAGQRLLFLVDGGSHDQAN